MRAAPSSKLRLFVALELPASVLRQLSTLLAELQLAIPPGAVRWVRPEGVHLTLQFYGDVEKPRVAAIEGMLRQAAQSSAPVSLALNGLGCFPHAKHPRVVWVGVAGDVDALRRLQRAVEGGARPLGFEPEARGFSPHLTLGRVNSPLRPNDQQRLAEALGRAPAAPGAAFILNELSLMQSDLKPGGAVYTRLFSAPLGSRNE